MRSNYPLLWITLSFSAGILGSKCFGLSLGLSCVFVLLSALGAIVAFRWGSTSTAFLLIMFFLIGGIYVRGWQVLPKNHIVHVAKYYPGKSVAIEGLISSDVEKRDFFRGKKTNFMLEVSRLKTRWGWRNKSGRLLVNVFREADLEYGDYVYLEGKIHKPFEFSSDGTFSYQEYLSRKGVRLILSVKKIAPLEVLHSGQGNPLRSLSLRVKRRLKAVLEQRLSRNESGLMQAILLGDRYNIPKHIKKLCEFAGVSHILAISGLHLGMIAFLIFLFLKLFPIPRKWQYLLTMFLLVFYAFLSGGRPSVVRATIMAVIFLASFLLERETNSINTLSLAAMVVLLINPLNIFDVGFQLSFLSVFSIIYFYPQLMNLFPEALKARQPLRYLTQSLAVSVSAYLGVAGLIAYYFRIITPISILANLVVIPMTAVIVTLGAGLLLSGIFLPPVAFAFALCLKVALNTLVAIIFLFTRIPGAYFYLKLLPAWTLGAYYILIFPVFHYHKVIFELFHKNRILRFLRNSH